MIYECIKGFSVDIVDGNGFTDVQDGFVVEEGTKWEIDTDTINVTGADIHLEEVEDTGNWLEVPKEILLSHFNYMGKNSPTS